MNEKENIVQSDSIDDSGKNLGEFWRIFKRHWKLTLSLAVAFAVITFALFKLTFVPMYRSSVRFTITPLVSGDSSSGASVYNFNYTAELAAQMAETFPYIMKSNILTDIMKNDIGKPVNATISANAVSETNIFEVSVTSTHAQDAYDVINSLIKNYPKVAEYVVGDTRMVVIEGSEPDLPTKPYNTWDYLKYVALAAVLGVAIAAVISYLIMYYRRTIMNKHDIEVQINGKCLCEIPEVEKKRTSSANSMIKASAKLSSFSESIHVLKQRARSAMKADNSKIIGITSARPGEGKTTIAYNLAKALSTGKNKVLLLDMDLRRRSLQVSLNKKKTVSDAGITDVAAGLSNIDDVINSVSNTFEILFAGTDDTKFRKQQYEPIMEYLKSEYDYIIVDLSNCGLASETTSIADLCDSILFVVKWNSVSIDDILSASKYMSFSKAKMVGYVLNAVPTDEGERSAYKYYGRYGRYHYGYGYRYGYRRQGYGYGYGYGYSRSGIPNLNESQDFMQNPDNNKK